MAHDIVEYDMINFGNVIDVRQYSLDSTCGVITSSMKKCLFCSFKRRIRNDGFGLDKQGISIK